MEISQVAISHTQTQRQSQIEAYWAGTFAAKNFILTAQYLLGVDSVKVTSEKDIEEDQEAYNTWVPEKADDDTHSNGRRNNEVRKFPTHF